MNTPLPDDSLDPLPPDAAEPGVYYLLQDSRGVAEYLAQAAAPERLRDASADIKRIADDFWRRLIGVVQQEFPIVAPYEEDAKNRQMRDAVMEWAGSRDDVAVVSLDRYLAPALEEPLAAGGLPYMQLQMSRVSGGERIARQNARSLPDQLDAIVRRMAQKRILVTDDTSFSGGTLRKAVAELRSRNLDVQGALAFLGNPEVTNADGVPVRSLYPLERCIDSIDTRDFTLLGGRVTSVSADGSVGFAAPYIAPFSEGKEASLSPQMLDGISRRMLAAQRQFFAELQKVFGKTLTLRDATRAGMTIPAFFQDTPLQNGMNASLQDACDAALRAMDERIVKRS